MATTFLRRVALCLIMAFTGVPVARAVDAPQDRFIAPTVARHRACLEASPPAVLEGYAASDGAPRFLRARLVFRAGELQPDVEWLWKTDDDAAARLASHLRSYRMPCLQVGEKPQAVVQDFRLTPARLEASEPLLAHLQGASTNSCYDAPDMALVLNPVPRRFSKALLYFRFSEQGGPPEVEIAHYIGPAMYALDVKRFVRRYRPCSGGRTIPGLWHQQLYEYVPDGQRLREFKPLDLLQFLRQVKGVDRLTGHFDTNTMQCPFEVSWTLFQPLPNQAGAKEADDGNRSAFLDWLGHLQMDLPPGTQEEMFGRRVTINVPCMTLELKP